MNETSYSKTLKGIQDVKELDRLDSILILGLKTMLLKLLEEYQKGSLVNKDILESIWQGINELDIHLLNRMLLIDEVDREITSLVSTSSEGA